MVGIVALGGGAAAEEDCAGAGGWEGEVLVGREGRVSGEGGECNWRVWRWRAIGLNWSLRRVVHSQVNTISSTLLLANR